MSVRQLAGPDFVPHLRRVLGTSGLAAGRLGRTITESALTQDEELIGHVLDDVHALGGADRP